MPGVIAFIGLGSNLQNPISQLQRAKIALTTLSQSELIATSNVFGSRPMGPQDQPDFANAVAAIRTELSPADLLTQLQEIEFSQGRVRKKDQWGPRTLDLDLLAYGDLVMTTERLTLPHPGAHLRDFVLVPWCSIAPEAEIPGKGKVCDLAKRCMSHGLVLLDAVP